MKTDHILFIHGVNVRNPKYSEHLFSLIQKRVSPSIQLSSVPLYWGDVNEKALQDLLKLFEKSSVWSKMWFQDFRKTQLLQFAGDAALYISRLVGSEAVTQMKAQALKGLKDYRFGEDRLHLVTHSWGTVILFDILFANRWLLLPEDDPGRQGVEAIRKAIYGIEPEASQGYRLASIHTMGSPIALFSLITLAGRNLEGASTHDLIPALSDLLDNLCAGGRKIPWDNFIHPGDPVAWPLEQVVRNVVDANGRIAIEDVLTEGSGPLEWIAKPLKGTFLALVNGGSAHGSYWTNAEVAKRIGNNILEAAGKD